ncbi:hypothetical protein E1578_23330 [Salmonella enterica subsp. enterica]|nr:hypothetical protein [Salmonella enterica subsp. enterica serovar Typhimurium]EBS5057534.1 hypothetical protein [Salmonella enterica subsp. enterica serovar Stanley]ECB7885877.1 hypothetical protein [Salmonella enterica subsp. enterica serovar Gaminara]ECI7782138.1 hypothetical protein [Salmonella enterica subsp. enterica]EIS8939447.1 hypothetical protein [Salmonella enterica]
MLKEDKLSVDSSRVITIEFPFSEPEIYNILTEQGIKYKTPGDFGLAFDSIELQVFVDIVSSPSVLPSLASVCVAYLHRNRGKRIVIKRGGEVIDLKGYSLKEVSELLKLTTDIKITDKND